MPKLDLLISFVTAVANKKVISIKFNNKPDEELKELWELHL